MNNPESFESDRLIYTRVDENDLKFFLSYLTNPIVTRYLPLGEPYPEEEILKYVTARIDHWQKYRFGIFMLKLKSTGEKIGYGGLSYVGETEFIDIRYGLIEKYWGLGLAMETACRLLEYGFKELELMTIYGVSVPENSASVEILKKIGMQECSHVDFYEADVEYYKLSKTDYQNR